MLSCLGTYMHRIDLTVLLLCDARVACASATDKTIPLWFRVFVCVCVRAGCIENIITHCLCVCLCVQSVCPHILVILFLREGGGHGWVLGLY